MQQLGWYVSMPSPPPNYLNLLLVSYLPKTTGKTEGKISIDQHLRLPSTALKAVGIVNISKTVTDIYLKQNVLFRDKKLLYKKCLNAFEPATSHTARTLFAPNYLVTVKSLILKIFLALLHSSC